jgi:hypothetical protein
MRSTHCIFFIATIFLHGIANAQNTTQPSNTAPAGITAPANQPTNPVRQERQNRRREAFAERLRQMSPEQRERALMRLLKRVESNERRQKMRVAMDYFQSLPPAEQQRLRQKFQSERALRTQQRAAKREQTRALLRSLSVSQRQVLKQKLQTMDAKGKAAFRDQLLAAPPVERERLLGQ